MQQMNSRELTYIEGKLQEAKKNYLFLSVIMLVGFLIISYIIFIYMPLNENTKYLKFIPALVILLDGAVLYFVMYIPFRNLREDFSGKKKEVFSSQIEKVEERQYRNTRTYFWLLKNKMKITVEASQFDLHIRGEDLTFHLAPNSKILLLVE